MWTSGGLDKLEIYRGLGVREVWYWKDRVIRVYLLDDSGSVDTEASGSEVLPDVDLVEIAKLVEELSQPQAVREYRKRIRARREG